MLGLLIAVLGGVLVAAAIGAFVSGLFWLTVIAFAVLLFIGAVALSFLPPYTEDDVSPAPARAHVVLIGAERSARRRAPAHVGGGLRRAA